MSMQGKVVIITGGTKGIGKSAAQLFSKEGAKVVVSYRSDPASAEALVKELGGSANALSVRGDASNINDIQTLVDETVKAFGKIDVVIPNAAMMKMIDLEHATEESYEAHFASNVKGPLFLVQKAVPHMAPGSRVILISTGVNIWTSVPPTYLLYAATKGAIDQMVRVLSKDLGKKGISVNAIAPGPTGTELFYEGKPQHVVDAIAALSPFNRIGKPEEVANAMVALAGPQGAWISGQVIRANGAAQV